MQNIRAIIIDDEENAIITLTNYLNEFCSQVEILATAQNVDDAVKAITDYQPDLLFLDIHIGTETGFQVIEQTLSYKYKTIFVTAHDEYALKAFRYCALDYILKPLDPHELMEAVKKLDNNPVKEQQKREVLIENSRQENKKLVLSSQDSLEFVKLKDILRCESSGNYTYFFLQGGKKITVSKSIKEYDDLLSEAGFFRAHQSHLVNINHVSRYIKTDGGYIEMNDTSKIPLARRRKEELLQAIGGKES